MSLWQEGATPYASPNRNARRDGQVPHLVVLHHTAMETAEAALARLADPQAQPTPVSVHYVIAEDGRLWQMVPEAERAWHAGLGHWAGQDDINSRSIGIELANPAPNPFAEPQMARLERLLPQILARWAIPPEGVIAHSDMAPTRKADPGPKFDWRRLALQGLSIWPDRGAVDSDTPLAQSLARIGYPLVDPAAAFAAFRLRFRPWAQGPEQAEDRRIAADLARRYPARPGPGAQG